MAPTMSASPNRMLTLLPNSPRTEAARRRCGESSRTSSWCRVARWISSTAAASEADRSIEGASGAAVAATSRSSRGLSSLPATSASGGMRWRPASAVKRSTRRARTSSRVLSIQTGPHDAVREPLPIPAPIHAANRPGKPEVQPQPRLQYASAHERRGRDEAHPLASPLRIDPDRDRWPLTIGTVVLVSSPDLMRELFAKSGPALAGGAARQFAEWFFGSDSLLILDDKRHRDERGELLTLFSPERIAHAEATAREVAAETLARVPSAEMLRLGALLDAVVLDIAVRLMFGRVNEATGRRLRHCVLGGLTSQGWDWPFLLFPRLRRDLGRWSPGGRAARLMAEFRALLADQVTRIRSGHGCPESWLFQLLAMEGEPRDDDATVNRRVARMLTIFAGMVTVAVALRWGVHHLLDRPDVLARARDEARAAGSSSYVEAVCKETMRIHPAIPVVARLVTSATVLGSYH